MKNSDLINLPDGIHLIESGLYIRVRGNSRSYVAKLMVEGKRKEISLGSANRIDLRVAKVKFEALKFRQVTGELTEESLLEEKARKKQASQAHKKQEPKEALFKEFAESTIHKIASAKRWTNTKSLSQWENTMATYVYPIIGDKLVKDLTREDIVAILAPIWETKTDTASKLRGRLEKIFSYAIFEGKYKGLNPAIWRGNLELILPPPSKVSNTKHHEAMSMLEASVVAKGYFESADIGKLAVLFGMLTAARVQEFIYAKWEEVDFENKVWLCPPERRKDRKKYPHRVPLSSQVISILDRIDRVSDYIFTAPRKGYGPLSLDSCRVQLQRTVKRKVTMHGCRSTFRDWCADNLIDPILAEKSLMHATGNEVEQAYQRSDLLELRREVMQKWANALLN